MASVVLIHGAHHGGWCWEEIVPRLTSKGHRVHAPDLPGMGEDRTAISRDVLAQWIGAVTALVDAGRKSTVLVGHSSGGALIGALAEQMPGSIALAIFLAGTLLSDGESVMTAGVLSEALRCSLVPNGAGTAVSIPPDAARHLFYSGVTSDVADRALARLVEQPLQPVATPIRLTLERFGSVPKAYIATTDDRAILLCKQREMQKNWACREIVEMTTGHSSFYASPDILAEHIDRLVSLHAPRRED